MIEIRQLDRKFGAFALKSIDLKVNTGVYAVVLGPSGCGKSLLLSTLAGIHRPDRGCILLDGQEVTGWPPERRPFGLVFQKPSLFPHLDVTGNLTYGLRVSGVGRAEKNLRLQELVEVLKLQVLLNRPVASLSGGEAQKVVLARTLALRPKVLLLDEPLSQLDHNARLELQEELSRIHKQFQLTTLHVTHSREEAQTLGESYTIMLAGRILQTGEKSQVTASPTCKFVAGFLGLEPDLNQSPVPQCTETCLDENAHCDRILKERADEN